MKSRMLLLLFSFFVITATFAGCAQGFGGKIDESRWEPGLGDLPNRIGQGTELAESPVGFPSLWDHDALPRKTGFSEPTGKWFFNNGAGRLGYGLTGGVRQPGDSFAVTLFGHDEGGVQVDRDMRIRLISRTMDLAEQSVILDETVRVGTVTGEQEIYSGLVPANENALYTLSAEFLDGEGVPEDTRVALIYVPRPEIRASVRTDKSVYGKNGTEGTLIVANDGPTVLVMGKDYSIEKKVDDSWRKVPLDLAFPGIALYLLPGQTNEDLFRPSTLDEGTYRIIKHVWADGIEELNAVMAAEFEVVR